MNTLLLKFISIIIMLSLTVTGCKKDVILPIVSELPILYQGCNLKEGKTVIIDSQVGVDTVFSSNLVAQITDLQNIDFSKYMVLVGADVYTHGIDKIEHSFIKTGESNYTYKVNVYYLLTLPAGTFYYGIIIDKISSTATVNFEVIKIGK